MSAGSSAGGPPASPPARQKAVAHRRARSCLPGRRRKSLAGPSSARCQRSSASAAGPRSGRAPAVGRSTNRRVTRAARLPPSSGVTGGRLTRTPSSGGRARRGRAAALHEEPGLVEGGHVEGIEATDGVLGQAVEAVEDAPPLGGLEPAKQEVIERPREAGLSPDLGGEPLDLGPFELVGRYPGHRLGQARGDRERVAGPGWKKPPR